MNDYRTINEILIDSESKNIILIGFKSEKLIQFILNYVKINSGNVIVIDPRPQISIDDIIMDNSVNFTLYNENSLKKLDDFQDYDAIFIDGNPNWYTVYNELNIVEKNCKKFPLIFVCNSSFPHERRDTYYYFDCIPFNYQHVHSKNLVIFQDIHDKSKRITIKDDDYHAIYQNSQKNGVLTAIEDYIKTTTLNVDKTLVDSETGIQLVYFKNHPLFERFLKLENTNKFHNLYVRNEYLNRFVVDLLENNANNFSEIHNEQLINKLSDYRDINHNLNILLTSKERLLKFKDEIINSNDELLQSQESVLSSKEKLIISKDMLLNSKEELIKSNQELLNCKDIVIESKDSEILSKNLLLKYDDVSINLLKTSNFRFITIILSYLYIIYKFKWGSELKLNLKLFNLIKNKNWLNWGFYLENNSEINTFKWLKLLTPEVHYVCNGYYEGRLPKPNFDKKLKKEDIIETLTGGENDV